jgi:hypothetical protein
LPSEFYLEHLRQLYDFSNLHYLPLLHRTCQHEAARRERRSIRLYPTDGWDDYRRCARNLGFGGFDGP